MQVCGSDGETYESVCELEREEGERFDYEGEACRRVNECSALQYTCTYSNSTVEFLFHQASVKMMIQNLDQDLGAILDQDLGAILDQDPGVLDPMMRRR